MTLPALVASAVYTPVGTPTISPRPYGLFSVAPPEGAAEGWQFGIQWESVACAVPGVWNDPCVGGTSDLKSDTRICFSNQVDSFAVYLRGTRSGPGADDLTMVEEALRITEERAVEAALWAQLLAGAAPPPVTIPGSIDYPSALGVAEAALALNYAGLGVIHVSPYVATMLAEYMTPFGDRQYTRAAGTPVVVGAGYGHEGIIGSGQLLVHRGELSSVDVFNREINDAEELAERTYAVGWDCYAVQVPVTP